MHKHTSAFSVPGMIMFDSAAVFLSTPWSILESFLILA
jgi:hypothetical protein